MLHSSGMAAAQWRGLFAALGGRRRVAPDLLGYGRNPAWPADRPFEASMDLAVAEALLLSEDGPVDVVGHSYGGWLAMSLAARHPDRVRRVVLHEPVLWGVLGSAGSADDATRWRELLVTAGVLSDDVPDIESWLRGFVDFWSGAGAWDAMPEARKAPQRRIAAKLMMEVRGLCLDEVGHDTWATIKAPIRITVGERAPAIEVRALELLAPHLQDVALRRVPGGHMAPLTHPEGVIRQFVQWLTAPTMGRRDAE